jgi:hypothetical protein
MPADAGQHEVEQDQRRGKALYMLPSCMAIGSQSSLKMYLAQGAVEQRGMKRFVFYDLDHPLCHTK